MSVTYIESTPAFVVLVAKFPTPTQLPALVQLTLVSAAPGSAAAFVGGFTSTDVKLPPFVWVAANDSWSPVVVTS
jgi:hypothetical protein